MKLPHLRADLKFDTLIMLDPTVPLREQALDLFDIRRRDDAARLDVRRQRALDVERPVFRDDLLLGAGVGVEIDRQTFAREMPLVGRQIDPLKAVPGIFVGFEDYRAIEEGRKRGNFVFVRLSWVRVKLDRPAPALIPFPVEVDQQIQTAVQLGLRIVVEIDVSIEFLPVPISWVPPPYMLTSGNRSGMPVRSLISLRKAVDFR